MRPLLLSLLVVPLLLGGCDGDDVGGKEGAPVGTVITSSSPVEGRSTFVQLPLGRVDLTIASARHDLPAYDETYDAAADGASLVGVGWDWDILSAVPGMTDSTRSDVEPSFTLVADGRDYSLDRAMLTRYDEDPVTESDSPLQFDGSAWVAVAGEPRELSIKVEYDGLTQEVDPAEPAITRDNGAAQPLYRPQTELAALPVACEGPGRVTPSFTFNDATCTLSVTRLPYVQEVGWAPDDAPWVVVDLRLYGGSSVQWQRGGATEVYGVDEEQGATASVDGVEPVSATEVGQDGGHQRLVFAEAAAGGTLRIDASVTTTGSGDGAAPDNPTVFGRWTAEVPDAI